MTSIVNVNVLAIEFSNGSAVAKYRYNPDAVVAAEAEQKRLTDEAAAFTAEVDQSQSHLLQSSGAMRASPRFRNGC